MSVVTVMVDVLRPVTTLLEATIVHAPQAACWTPMVMLVMVSCIKLYVHNCSICHLHADINECSAGTDNCAQNCQNNGNCGGFSCSCDTGYTLDSNGHSCSG